MGLCAVIIGHYLIAKIKPDSPKKSIDTSQNSVVEKMFGVLQIMSACAVAFAHGSNDVANAIGPLAAIVHIGSTGVVDAQSPVPSWLLLLGGFGIVIGLATMGYRVMGTIGTKITKLTPSRGYAAEFAAALTIVIASRLGLPISTTHTLVGGVMGVGLTQGIKGLDLKMISKIGISWLVTVPAGAILAIIFFYTLKYLF